MTEHFLALLPPKEIEITALDCIVVFERHVETTEIVVDKDPKTYVQFSARVFGLHPTYPVFRAFFDAFYGGSSYTREITLLSHVRIMFCGLA